MFEIFRYFSSGFVFSSLLCQFICHLFIRRLFALHGMKLNEMCGCDPSLLHCSVYAVWYSAHYYVIQRNQLISISIKKPFLVVIVRRFIMWREETMKTFRFYRSAKMIVMAWKSIIRITNSLHFPPPCHNQHFCLSVSRFACSFSFTIVYEIQTSAFNGLLQVRLFIDFIFKHS